ncbi:hypothetical protein L7F22_000288 [Adiantum nelumboides]|nr:hypothetical protein [Adiantum nelumboides]
MRAAEHRDTDTGDHIARVAGYVGIIAANLGFDPAGDPDPEARLDDARCRKIGVPDAILLKPRPALDRGARPDGAPRRARPAHPGGQHLRRRAPRRRDRREPPRALGRHRLSAPAARRGDPARRPHRGGGGRAETFPGRPAGAGGDRRRHGGPRPGGGPLGLARGRPLRRRQASGAGGRRPGLRPRGRPGHGRQRRAAAAASLRAIGNVPSIVYGAIERPDGSVLAEQGIGLRLTQDAALDGADLSLLHLFATQSLRATAPILENGAPVGRVVLIGEPTNIRDHVWGRLARTPPWRPAGRRDRDRRVVLPAAQRHAAPGGPHPDHGGGPPAPRLHQRAPVESDDEVGALARTLNDPALRVNERDHRLAAHSAHLEAEVQARTADLREAKQAADAANAAKSTFLATMSHEIRTPMNGVLVMAELLASADLPCASAATPKSSPVPAGRSCDHQRHPRLREGRGGQARSRTRAGVPRRDRRYRGDALRRAGPARPGSTSRPTSRRSSPRPGTSPSGWRSMPGTDASSLPSPIPDRHPPGQAGHDLLGLLAGRSIHDPPFRRDRPRALDRPADHRRDGRHRGGGEPRRRGLDLLGAHSRDRRRTRPADPAPRHGAGRDRAGHRRSRDPGCPRRQPERGRLRAVAADRGAAPAHWVLDAAALVAAGRRPDRAGRVLVLAGAGDNAADQALRSGLADAVLRWPVIQAEWRPLLAALAAGDPFTASAAVAVATDLLPQFPAARVLVADDSAVNREHAGPGWLRGRPDDPAARGGHGPAHPDRRAHGPRPRRGCGSRRGRRHERNAPEALHPAAARRSPAGACPVPPGRGTGGCGGIGRGPGRLADRSITRSSTQASPDGDLLDAEVLDGLLGLGDGAFLDRVLDLYRAQGPVALATLRSALAVSDQPAIARAAHSLKSMSANIGAPPRRARLRAIEDAARNAACAEPQEACDGLETLLAATIRDLEGRTRAQAVAA